MKNQIVVTGIVLQVQQIGDYDRRVTILTKELGKIGAFAKGVRKPGSPLLSYTQPCVFGEFTLYVGRDSYSINEVNVKEAFPELRYSLEKAYYGMYFCEVASFFSREGNDEKSMLNLLYASLKALVGKVIEDELVKAIFELKVMAINGESPLVTECVMCHEKEFKDKYFSYVKRGAVCGRCAGNMPASDRIKLNDSSWYAIWFITVTPIAKLFSFRLTDEVLKEVSVLAEKYLLDNTNHQFNGLDMLKMMVGT